MPRRANLDIDIDTRGLDDLLLLRSRDAKRVIAKALTATAKTGKTKAARQIGRSYGLRSTAVREHLIAFRARREDLRANIVAFGGPLKLAKAAKGVRQTKRGVRANAWGERELYKGTFIATMASGHRGVFKRATRGGLRVGRLPVRELFGPGVSDALADPEIHTPLREELTADAAKKVGREIDRELRRQAGKNR